VLTGHFAAAFLHLAGYAPCRVNYGQLGVFASKIQLLSKKSDTMFLCVKTSSGKVVATSFLYLMVHRRIAGDVPIYLKFALKVTHPFRKS